MQSNAHAFLGRTVSMNDIVGTAGGKLAHATVDNARYVTGRRSFFKYRDLGVTDATGGKMRAGDVRHAGPR